MNTNPQWFSNTDAAVAQRNGSTPALADGGDAMIAIDAAERVTFLNPAAEILTGWNAGEAAGQPISDVLGVVDEVTRIPIIGALVSLAGKEKYSRLANRALLVTRDQREYPIEGTIVAVPGEPGRPNGSVIVVRDTSALKCLESRLVQQARLDELTGLLNRREFEIRAEELICDASLTGRVHSAIVIDIDQFSVLNDTYGRGAGDALLRQLGDLLNAETGPTDVVARMGNDEFGIQLFDTEPAEAMQVAEDLLRTIRGVHFSWRAQVFKLNVSAGVAGTRGGAGHPGSFLTRADAACGNAKRKGGNRACLWDGEDLDMTGQRGQLQWVAGVARALDEDRLRLSFQEIKPIGDARDVGLYEVLLFMVDEDGKRIPPEVFIPAAERYHLMPTVDRWVIRNAFAALARRRAAGDLQSVFAINLSATSLCDERLSHFIREQLAAHAIPARAICFEITETAAVENLDRARAFIDEMRAIGCTFALDDFGRGTSSFAHLKVLAVDYLKIDGMFVTGMNDNAVDRAMVKAFNWIGHVKGLKTIAEHVEDDATLARLRDIGVDYVQGYGIAHPAVLDTRQR